MDTSVYIFLILVDVFISFTIFAIYFYVLFKYYIHKIEENGLAKFFRIHIEFYKPLFTIYKLYSDNLSNPNKIPNLINSEINKIEEMQDNTDFSIGTYLIVSMILGQFIILCILFYIYYDKIRLHISTLSIIYTILINGFLIISVELLFVFFVYCNIDLFNIAAIFNI